MGDHFDFKDRGAVLCVSPLKNKNKKMQTKLIALLFLGLPFMVSSFLFGVQVTDQSGNVIGGADTTQTAGVIGLALLGSALGFAGLNEVSKAILPDALSEFLRKYGENHKSAGAYRRQTRHTRQAVEAAAAEEAVEQVVEENDIAAAVDEALNNGAAEEEEIITINIDATKEELLTNVFETIGKLKYTGCFQRLVCDISSKPEDFQGTISIVKSVKESQKIELSEEGAAVAASLTEAVNFGELNQNMGYCEKVFDQCQFTGDAMAEVTMTIKEKIEASKTLFETREETEEPEPEMTQEEAQ